MIIIVTKLQYDKNYNRYKKVVSHGVDDKTGKAIVLPQQDPIKIGAKYNWSIGEYVLEN